MTILPCPCCGNANLYKGHLSATSMGVECLVPTEAGGGCGLSLAVGYRESIPMKRGEKLEDYDQRLLQMAIKKWNTRTK